MSDKLHENGQPVKAAVSQYTEELRAREEAELAHRLATTPLGPKEAAEFLAAYERANKPAKAGFENLCPSLVFLEAVFRVTGVADCGPGHVIGVIRSDQADLVRAVHAELVDGLLRNFGRMPDEAATTNVTA
jgi:hypothetical protein